MWNYKNIITLELGLGVFHAVSSPDTRGALLRMLTSPPEDDARLLLEEIKTIRRQAGDNVFIPTIYITDNENLEYNEFVCYWGIDCTRKTITNVEELYLHIWRKVKEYKVDNWDKIVAKNLLEEAIRNIQQGHNQEAYENYCHSYYISRVQEYYYECAKALTENACLLAISGNLELAIQYTMAASDLCEMPDIVDSNLMCKVNIHLGVLWLSMTNWNEANKCFLRSTQIASNSHMLEALFVSYIYAAQCFSLRGCYRDAIQCYQQALSMLNVNNPSALPIANQIYEEMVKVYGILLELKDNERKVVRSLEINDYFGNIIKRIAWHVFQCIANVMIYKICNVRGTTALFSFGEHYNVHNVNAKGHILIGHYNY